MRRERIPYVGAYHHIMNRGYDGNDIFAGSRHKSHFLDYLEESSKRMKIRIFAYCIIDNHYHLVLENSSGRMSDFCKLLNGQNGQYGMYYRKMEGGKGKGYVFQSRFKSTIIEDDGYLIKSIEYLLQNPVRAGIVYGAENYTWSSIKASSIIFQNKSRKLSMRNMSINCLDQKSVYFVTWTHLPTMKSR
jgi:putative transposase